MTKRARGQKKGFTLVELMIAVAITAIILASLMIVFQSQQKSYAQQTEISASQAAARGTLYNLAREIRMAGYTGIPLGFEYIHNAGTAYAIIPLRNGNDAIDAPAVSNALAGNLPADGSDAIEIWGNFFRRSTMLSASAVSGINVIQVDDGTLFGGSPQMKPGWLIIGNTSGSVSGAEIHRITDVTGNQITLATNLAAPYLGGQTVVAPINRRVYYIDPNRTDPRGNPTSALMQRNCLDEACTTNSGELVMAEEIIDLQFEYDTTDSALDNDLDTGQGTYCDPCALRGVKIVLTTRLDAYRDQPVLRDHSTTVRIRNIGFELTTCLIPGC